MRRMMAGVTLLALLITNCLAQADGLPLAAQFDVYKAFERNQSYKLEETGEWSAHDLIAAQVLRTISSGAARPHMSSGVCILYPSVRGNTLLGLTEVLLNICLVKTEPLGASSLSIVTEGIRYDFLNTSQKSQIGSYTCETFELPMDKQGMAMLRSIAESGGYSISIYGDTKQYRTTINEKSADLTDKQTIEALSMDTVHSFLSELDQNGLFRYSLWDLNAGHWAEDRPQMAVVSLSDEPYSEELPMLDEAFHCLVNIDRTAVAKLQQLLKDRAFYAGKLDGKFSTDTRVAIREAQRYHGLLQTGQADRMLIELLAGTEVAREATAETPKPQLVTSDQIINAEAGVSYRRDGVAEVQLDRRWFAKKMLPMLATTKPTPTQQTENTTNPKPTETPQSTPSIDHSAIVPKNISNMLLIIDGKITNLSTEPMFLPKDTQAEVAIGDQYVYPFTVRCEQGNGKTIGTGLLPLESARLVLFAEVPENVTSDHSITITLRIKGFIDQMDLAY